MKNCIIELFTIILIFLLTINIFAQLRIIETDKINPLQSNLETVIPIDSSGLDSLITAQMLENHIPGLTSCVVKGNQIVWNRATDSQILKII